ncbi:MAG: sigma-54 dependent transcriptional regulator [bacterium]|nr:sigma-54 dependent transcriptional regulator [bacterium]
MVSATSKILVVDDDPGSLSAMTEALERVGYELYPARSGAEAFQLLNSNQVDLVLTDLKMPTIDGMEILTAARRIDPNIGVIIITGYGSIENAVEAMKSGATHYLTKPINIEELQLVVKNALEKQKLIAENIQLKKKIEQKYGFENIIANSKPMHEIIETIKQIAPTRANVLITGESGTGKELIANAIHFHSTRANEPLIKLHCAALAEGVLESELFGHEKGAFTGAIRNRKGMFELADNGTLFLDEVSEIPLSTQVKLLRVIEEQEFMRVGGIKSIKVDVRIIAATNKDLKQAVADGKFRDDLFFRLNVVGIHIPPLRERQEDIPIMVTRFFAEVAKENNKPVPTISQEAIPALARYDWPGNVRELRNVIESVLVTLRSDTIQISDLPTYISKLPAPTGQQAELPVGLSMEEVEKEMIHRTLSRVNGNRTKAATILKIGLRTLHRKIKQYGLE